MVHDIQCVNFSYKYESTQYRKTSMKKNLKMFIPLQSFTQSIRTIANEKNNKKIVVGA